MKYVIYLVLGMAFGLFLVKAEVYPFNQHPKPEVKTVEAEPVPSNFTRLTEDPYTKNGITMWRDDKHGVVCFIYEAGIGQTSRAGISCLPRGQVLP